MLSYRKYLYLVGGLGCGLLLLYLRKLDLSEISLVKYTIFLMLMFFSELQTIMINDSNCSTEFCFVYSAAYIFGPVQAALMKVLSTAISQLYANIKYGYDNGAESIIFHVGQHVLSFLSAVGFYYFIKRYFVWIWPWNEIIFQSAAIGVYFALKSLLLRYFLALKYNRPIFKNITELATIEIPAFLIAVFFGIIAVTTYINNGFLQTLLVLAVYLIVIYIFIMYFTVMNINHKLAAAYDMAVTITSALDMENVMDLILNSVQKIIPWDTACLYVYQNGWLIPAIYEGYPCNAVGKLKLESCQSILGFSFTKEGIIVNNCHKNRELAAMSISLPDTKSIIAAPILSNNELIGEIVLTSKKNHIHTKKHLILLKILANQGAVAMKNARLFDEAAQMAVCDGLTGLYNYTYLYSELERQIKNVNARGGCLSFIIIDVDRFKSYNDMYGHVVGDTILKNFAGILRKSMRDSDIICRYGGEEFAIVLPGVKPNEALRIAERVREIIENTPLAQAGDSDIFITVSAGIASYPTDATSAQDLVNKADKAMIVGAKQKGRNKVVLFRPDMIEEN